MSRRKTLLGVFGISLGGIGVLVCGVAIIFLWMVSIRVGGAIASLFDRVDQSLAVVQQWGIEVNDRLTAAAITTDDLEKALEKLQDRTLKKRANDLQYVSTPHRRPSGWQRAYSRLTIGWRCRSRRWVYCRKYVRLPNRPVHRPTRRPSTNSESRLHPRGLN